MDVFARRLLVALDGFMNKLCMDECVLLLSVCFCVDVAREGVNGGGFDGLSVFFVLINHSY